MSNNSIIIIGAGFAGLSAGIYAQMNGYRSEIFELHNQPGGLCTSWKRRGYTIDGCIHWLVGSSPKSSMHRFWKEVGVAQGREFIDLDEFGRLEGRDGRTLILYSNIDRLEQHLLELSPQDAPVIEEFIQGARLGLRFEQPPEDAPLFHRLWGAVKLGWLLVSQGRNMQKWMKTSMQEFANRFQDPLLREAFLEMWVPEFGAFFMMFTFSYLHNKNAGYPIGGSLPMSRAMEKRYLGLGGQIHYESRVEKILVENDRAVGIRLVDGSEHRAGRVISAADGHATIFDMLEGRYADEKTKTPYEKWPIFQPLIFVGLGVNRSFEDTPKTVSGTVFHLKEPTEIGDSVRELLPVHIFNQDPTLAPSGKTSLVVMLNSRYDYWKELAADPAAYQEKKDQIARTVVSLLDQRWPGISNQVEMVDVATPLTFERYTGNWQGSVEGWLMTPQNAMQRISKTLPGLKNFYMCGQWVEPGGGLPTAVMSGRALLQRICKEDKIRFNTTIP